MKPAPFEYHRAESLEQTTALLAELGDEAKVLAGGQSLLPLLALRLTRYEHLVDAGRVAGLSGIERHNGTLTIGAMTRQRAAERSAVVAEAAPLIARALPLIGHFQIRNRGTVGGSLAHADPASELPAAALALDAELELASVRGTRRVTAADFFVGTWSTCAEPDEVLSALHIPVWSGRCGFAVEEFSRRHGDFALAGVMVGLGVDDAGLVSKAAISFLGMDSTPLRAGPAERALIGTEASAVDAGAVAAVAVEGLEPSDDIHLSGRHRVRVARRLTEIALNRATEEALA